MLVRASHNNLCFSDTGISIILEQVPIYSTQLSPEDTLKPPPTTEQTYSALDTLLSSNSFPQTSPLLSAFRALIRVTIEPGHSPSHNPTSNTDPYAPALESLYQSLKLRATKPCSNSLTAFLGLGQGLTPSGDDLIIGYLLTINRYRQLCPWISRLEFNSTIIATAYQRTTNLSANLIECAASGQADERLVNALDEFMSPLSGLDPRLSQLKNWGSSSGLDAWVGMMLALLDL